MRTAIGSDAPRWRVHGRRRTRGVAAAGSCALFALATACPAPRHVELADLQRDHERCLARERDRSGGVRYDDYKACMSHLGWSDAEFQEGTG